jgi:hypothetical protein
MQRGLKLNPDLRVQKIIATICDRLLCVRYRYDKQRNKRLKTVEIIIEETEWYPEKKEETPNRKVYRFIDKHIISDALGIGVGCSSLYSSAVDR